MASLGPLDLCLFVCTHVLSQPTLFKRGILVESAHLLCSLTSMRSFVFSCCVTLCRSQWPIPFVLGPDMAPNVEVSLDAPSKPLPSVSDEIGRLEADREAKQAINSDKMIRAFNKELSNARLRIAALVDGTEQQLDSQLRKTHYTSGQLQRRVEPSTSFLKSGIVRVAVAPEKPPPESTREAISNLEHARLNSEDAWVEAAVADMSRLTDVVVATVESEIRGVAEVSPSFDAVSQPSGFLQVGKSAHEHGGASLGEPNVRVVTANAPYPTVQSLVGSLESRRDISEEFEKAQALSMYMRLLKFENMLIESALKTMALKHQAGR